MGATIIIPVVSVVCTFLFFCLWGVITARTEDRRREFLNTERMAAISKGLDPPPDVKPGTQNSLEKGIIFLGIGLGMIPSLRFAAPDRRFWAWGIVVATLGSVSV